MLLWRGSGCRADIFIFWLEMSWIADNWLIIHNFNRLTNQRAGKVLRHQKVLRHRVAFLKVLNWSDFLILPLPDFAKGCRLFNSLWGFESHCVKWTVMRTWQIKILCTTCAGVRFPFLDFYFPCWPIFAVYCLETARANPYKVCAYVLYAHLVFLFIVAVHTARWFCLARRFSWFCCCGGAICWWLH